MKKTKEEAELTRTNILKAGMQVFLRKGFAASTIDDIAQEIGMTRGAVYWHFKNKEDLFYHLCNEQYERFSREIDEELLKPASAMEKLIRIVEINFNALYENADFRDFIQLTWFQTEAAQYDQLLKDKEKITEHFMEALIPLIEEGQRQEEFQSGLIPEEVALTLVILINGIFRGYFISPERMGDQRITSSILYQYIESLIP